MTKDKCITLPEGWTDTDPATREWWLEVFQSPSVPVLAHGNAASPSWAPPCEPVDDMTADWYRSQQFPVVAVLRGEVCPARAPATASARRRDSEKRCITDTVSAVVASNFVMTKATFVSGGNYAVVQ